MKVIIGLLQILCIAGLAVSAFLLATDPRLLNLVEQDLSQVIQGTLPGGKSTSSQPGKSGSGPTEGEGNSSDKSAPVTTESGYTISRRCALWSVEGFDLYYSPVEPATLCAQPPGSGTKAGSLFAPGSTPISENCAFAPDGKIYCLAGGTLSTDTLGGLYARGELAP